MKSGSGFHDEQLDCEGWVAEMGMTTGKWMLMVRNPLDHLDQHLPRDAASVPRTSGSVRHQPLLIIFVLRRH